jgi:hypothetical protein
LLTADGFDLDRSKTKPRVKDFKNFLPDWLANIKPGRLGIHRDGGVNSLLFFDDN